MKLQVGVKVLIENKEKKHLFLQRSQILGNEQEAYWDIPGGRIEADETLHDALKREIFEETGLRIRDRDVPHLLFAQDIFAAKADLHVVRLTYSVPGDGDVKVSDEHTAFKWLTLDNALSLNLDPFLREAIERKKTPAQ
jgi:8-oxo-dGTP pyrophosphatase MutT (NUDIX family)